MKKMLTVTLGVAALAIGSMPIAAQAQVADAIQAVNDAIVELTDAPGLGFTPDLAAFETYRTA